MKVTDEGKKEVLKCHGARLEARPSRMGAMWLHAPFATALADLISHVI